MNLLNVLLLLALFFGSVEEQLYRQWYVCLYNSTIWRSNFWLCCIFGVFVCVYSLSCLCYTQIPLRHQSSSIDQSIHHIHLYVYDTGRNAGTRCLLTCFRSRSLLADKHVTRYLVRFRNEPNTSSVRWSRDERCNMNEMTRKPRFWIMCCCTVWELSTSSQMKPNNLELLKRGGVYGKWRWYI